MTYASITSYNMTNGFQTIFVYVNDVSGGIFINLLLFIIWFSVTVSIYFAQKKSTAQGDLPMALATGGFVTIIVTILLNLVPGLVHQLTYFIVFVAATFSVFWFLSHKKEGY